MLILIINKSIREIEREHGLHHLPPNCRSILYQVASDEAEGHEVNVFSVVREIRFGTPPTVYARLKRLEKGGWIRRRRHSLDGRMRAISLTPRARKLFSVLSDSAFRAAVNTAKDPRLREVHIGS